MINSDEKSFSEIAELDHLIKLLDDEDERIYDNIKERFIRHGNNTAVFLNKYLNDENHLIKKRAREIVTEINFEKIRNKMISLSEENENDFLEKALLLVSEFGYPGVDMKKYSDYLNDITLKIKSELLEVNSDVNSVKINILLSKISDHLIYDEGFRIQYESKYDPDECYINRVIDKKSGNLYLLTLIFMMVLRKMNIRVIGVNFTGHLLLKYENGKDEFYIDPFSSDVILTRKYFTDNFKNIGLKTEDFDNLLSLKKSGDKELILKLLRHLSDIYSTNKDFQKVNRLEQLMISLA